QRRRDRSESIALLQGDSSGPSGTGPTRGQLRVMSIPQYRRAPGYFRQPEASLLATSRDDRARCAWPRAASCLVWSWSSLLISYIDDVNIYLTGVALAGRRIFTPSTFGSAIQPQGRPGQHRATNLAIATRFRDPGHPQPPRHRVRARPVLHLEEPAATLPAPATSLSVGQAES